MVFKIQNSIEIYKHRQTSRIMMSVCLAILPSITVQFYFFGWGTLFQILLGCTSALAAEALVLQLRKKSVMHTLADNSALVTGLLLSVSIPPLSPWWIAILGNIFAIIIAKHLYGGLGNNLFNPAMVGYVVLLISFPVQMTSWFPPHEIAWNALPNFMSVLKTIFYSDSSFNRDIVVLGIEVDGTTQATPLDRFKTSLHIGNVKQIIQYSSYHDIGATSWQLVNLAWLIGGLFLLWQRAIRWHIPVSFLVTIFLFATFGKIFSPDSLASPKIHLLSGATMLGAFFILTDPVTASTTNCGRLIFGSIAAILVWLIRSFGGYPDGIAFSVLIANMVVPIIDYYTRPRTYAHR